MKEGRIICEGNPAELKAREGEGYKLNVKMKHLHQKKDLDDFPHRKLTLKVKVWHFLKLTINPKLKIQ